MNKEILALEDILKKYLNNDIEIEEKLEQETIEKKHYEFISDSRKREAVKSGLSFIDAYNFFIDYSIKRNNKEVTIRNKQYKLASFKKFLKHPLSFGFNYDVGYYNDITLITEGVINDFLSTRNRHSTVLVSSYYSVIRALFNYLEMDRLIISNPVNNIKLKNHSRKELRVLSHNQIISLINLFNKNRNMGLRNLLFVLLILDTGLLVSELVNIRNEDVLLQSIVIKSSNGIREIDISENTKKLLEHYIEDNCNEDSLFQNSNNNKYDPRTITRMLSSKSKIIGFDIKPTILRDTFAMDYLQSTGDFVGLAYILGTTIDNVKYRYSCVQNSYKRISDIVL